MKYIKIILLTSLANFAFGQTNYTKILTEFDHWKQEQFANGNYETEANCNMEYTIQESYEGNGMGIPKEIQIFFTDFNFDNKIDALVCFNITQCDGGNALSNAQDRILIISKNEEYYVDDNFINDYAQKLSTGWLRVIDALDGTIRGQFQDYGESDAPCCPSINKEFSISYFDKSFEIIENNN